MGGGALRHAARIFQTFRDDHQVTAELMKRVDSSRWLHFEYKSERLYSYPLWPKVLLLFFTSMGNNHFK